MAKGRKSEIEISDFIYNLERSPESREKHIFSSQFIAENTNSIDDYLKRHDTTEYGRRLRRLVREHSIPTRGESINMSTGAYSSSYSSQKPNIKSFRLSTQKDYSMTVASLNSAAKLTGYMVAAGLVAFVIYMGFQIKKDIIENPNNPIALWVQKVNNPNYDKLSQ